MLEKELTKYLGKNKHIIEGTKIEKSNTGAIENNPKQMLSETVLEVEIITKK